MNLKTVLNALKTKGLYYILFRISYELRRKTGLMKLQYRTAYRNVEFISLEEFRKDNRFFFCSRETLDVLKERKIGLKDKAQRILHGEIPFFSNIWFDLGMDYDWVTNPETGFRYNNKQHWSKIEDIVLYAGDIKFVWEKSRFTYLYYIAQYDYHFDEDHSDFVFSEIIDWIKKNPLNCGPNYKCSQEISIRVLNWIFFLYFYKKSAYLTEDKFIIIINSIFWQIKHIEANINFSRVCVRNNHAITETLTLYLTSLIMPWLPGSTRRKKNGKKWFEIEIEYQIADDGSFIQNSMNYHRVLIQLLTWAISLADKNGENFSQHIYNKALAALNFLYQCQDIQTGFLSNYGANDGALFFPLNNRDFRDYRPALDALHYLLTSKHLYDNIYEDYYWYYCKGERKLPPLKKQYGIVLFNNSGYYLIQEKDTLTFFRCGDFNNIHKGTADCLHLDVWYQGVNILCDAGSFKYNAKPELVEYFTGTESHNTIMLGNTGLMNRVMRFIWKDAPEILGFNFTEDNEKFYIEATIKSFNRLGDDIIVTRKIEKIKGLLYYSVIDTVVNKPSNVEMRQIWHTNSQSIIISSDSDISNNIGKCSDYYGSFYYNQQIESRSKLNRIETIIKLKR